MRSNSRACLEVAPRLRSRVPETRRPRQGRAFVFYRRNHWSSLFHDIMNNPGIKWVRSQISVVDQHFLECFELILKAKNLKQVLLKYRVELDTHIFDLKKKEESIHFTRQYPMHFFLSPLFPSVIFALILSHAFVNFSSLCVPIRCQSSFLAGWFCHSLFLSRCVREGGHRRLLFVLFYGRVGMLTGCRHFYRTHFSPLQFWDSIPGAHFSYHRRCVCGRRAFMAWYDAFAKNK